MVIKEKVRKCSSIVLSLCLILTFFASVPAKAAETLATDDGNFNYTVLTDGTVEISKYVGSGTKVTIPEKIDGKTVTSIGDHVFEACRSLTAIEIPAGVTDIGYYAFWGCSSLTAIEIPASVKWIGDGAFMYCSSLTAIEIPASVKWIGDRVFSNCSSLTEIKVEEDSLDYIAIDGILYDKKRCQLLCCPGGKKGEINISEKIDGKTVTSIGHAAFSGCSSLIAIEIPAEVTSIGGSAFSGCRSLTAIEIPAGVTNIGDLTFSDCIGLTAIEIPAGVTSIGDAAFQDCSSLTAIEIPAGVTSIGDLAFIRCSSLTAIEIPASVTSIGESAFSGCTGLKEMIIPDGVTEIEERVFKGCSNLSSVTIPGSVTKIADDAFSGCNKDIVFYVEEGSYAAQFVADKGLNYEYYNANEPEEQTDFTYSENEDGTLTITGYTGTKAAVEVPSEIDGKKVTIIGNKAFYQNGIIESIKIPKGVTKIGDYVFYECRKLTEADLPEGLEQIGSQAFIFSGLTKAVIPEGVVNLGLQAFAYCGHLTDIKLPSTLKVINGYAFSYASIGTITIPESVNYIGNRAFSNCENLKIAYLPNWNKDRSMTFYGDAFSSCHSSLTLYVTADSYGQDYAEKNGYKYSVVEEVIPNNSDYTYEALSDGTLKLTNYIGTASDVTVPEEINGEKVSVIGKKCFYQCQTVVNVIVSDGINTIEDSAFSLCHKLETIILGKDVKEADGCSFGYCRSLKNITVDVDNPYLASDDEGCLYTKEMTVILCCPEKAAIGRYEIKASVTVIGNQAFVSNSNITEVVFPQGLEKIEARAFYACEKLKTFDIPEGVTEIGDRAFCDCTAMTEVKIPSTVKELTPGVLEYCDSLKKVVIPDSVTKIADDAFRFSVDNLTLYVIKGSYAENYAVSKGISYISQTGEESDIAKMAEEAKAQIDAAAREAKAKIDAMPSLSEEEKAAAKKAVDEAAQAAKTAAENATTSSEVSAAKNSGISGVSGAVTNAQQQNDSNALNQEKQEIKGELEKEADAKIDSIEKDTSLTEEEKNEKKNEIKRLLEEAKKKIDEALDSAATKAAGESTRGQFTDVVNPNKPDGIVSLPACSVEVAAGNYVYTGRKIQPAVTVRFNGATLQEQTDYVLTYENNINAGKARVIVHSVPGRTKGEQTQFFVITKSAAQKSKIHNKTLYIDYTGKKLTDAKIKRALQDKYLSADVKLGRDYTLSYTAKKAVPKSIIGKASGIRLTVTFKGNYTGTAKMTIIMQPAKPASMKAKKKSGAVALTWKKVAGADGYYIYRGTKKHAEPNTEKGDKYLGKVTAGKTLKFTDKTAKKGKTYYYYITSYKKRKGKVPMTSKSVRVKVKY